MKILLISSSAPFGKGESFVISEVNAIARAGHDVTLVPTIIRRGTPNEFELHDGINLLAASPLSARVLLSFLKYAGGRPVEFFRLVRWIQDKGLKNTLKNLLVLPKAIWLAGLLKTKPIDHIHAHWLTTPSTLAMLVSRLTSIPWSVSAHRGDIVMNNLLAEKIARAEFVRFISKSGVALARARADLDEDKVRILHLGVAIPEIRDLPPVQSGELKSCITILCPANLIRVKGHSLLLKSLSRMEHLEKISVIFAGDGNLKDSLEQEARQLGLQKRVSFEGHVPHCTLLGWYREGAIDLVVLPSQDLGGGIHEGIPVSLMEAMAHAVPVVSTETGGIPELLRGTEGELFGGLVAATDIEGLARTLDDYVGSASLRQKSALAGYSRVAQAFNQSVTVNRLVTLMKGAHGSTGHGPDDPETSIA